MIDYQECECEGCPEIAEVVDEMGNNICLEHYNESNQEFDEGDYED